MSFTFFPILFLRFWYIESPLALFSYFLSLNKAFLQVVSLSLLIQTFFKPWKNEYRKGLIGFSIGFGMVIKTVVILADLVMFVALCIVELFGIVIFLSIPIGTLLLLTVTL
jgi:hypothetical protein